MGSTRRTFGPSRKRWPVPGLRGVGPGVQNFIGNLSGIAAPWLTGLIIKTTGQFYWAFAVTSALLLLGTFCFTVLIRKVEPETWK